MLVLSDGDWRCFNVAQLQSLRFVHDLGMPQAVLNSLFYFF